ncbi:ecto-ADP-ribosyltransferase 5-like [Paramisgurnus dabryanus]|uniref:ecto-ADP-ribosyltransferase 5-like n=1 Tax=Paramisgurnus dabryanus TaxID=90735 RepID=UPI0031F36E80
MLTTTALILIVTTKVVLGQDDRLPVEGEILPLDMAVNSVDDLYDGCTADMNLLVIKKYLNQELYLERLGNVWKECLDRFPQPVNNLTRNNLAAICMYTGESVYRKFNQNVRTGKKKYKIDMHKRNAWTWHSLDFLLSKAIQILKETQQGCKYTYRGTGLNFREDVLNKEIRFGSFASSSFDREVAKGFGGESCFEIKTCGGADVSKYSEYSDEKEVLIPPYEKFKVTAIKKDDWCKTVFVLSSTGIRSDLNCALVASSIKPQKGLCDTYPVFAIKMCHNTKNFLRCLQRSCNFKRLQDNQRNSTIIILTKPSVIIIIILVVVVLIMMMIITFCHAHSMHP